MSEGIANEHSNKRIMKQLSYSLDCTHLVVHCSSSICIDYLPSHQPQKSFLLGISLELQLFLIDIFNQVLMMQNATDLIAVGTNTLLIGTATTTDTAESTAPSCDGIRSSSRSRSSNTCIRRREPFYMNQQGNSYILDSNLISHPVPYLNSLQPNTCHC